MKENFCILLYKLPKTLKKGQLLNKFSKISRPTNFKEGQIWFFGLEKAKPGNSANSKKGPEKNLPKITHDPMTQAFA